MKNKILKIIGIILLIGIIAFIIWKIISYEEKKFNKFEFESSYNIFNETETNYLDTIVYSGLKILNIDSIIVIIKPMEIKKHSLIPDDLDLKAHIISNRVQYIVYMSKMSKSNSIKILSHELIHLKQYYNKELIVINKDSIFWKNKLIDPYNYSYEDRPWEKEAFAKQHDLEIKMKDMLYEKE